MNILIMKKVTLILAVVFSFTYTYSANQKAYTKTNNIDSLYVIEEEADEAFDFDYKAYLPKDFKAYDLTDNGADPTQWVEEAEYVAFDFNHKDYLPVGFNPSEKFNALFLEDIKWVDEEIDEEFDFDTALYVRSIKEKLLITSK